MLWIGGSPDAIKGGFERAAQSGFEGLDQVQLHLAADGDGPIVYAIGPDYLRYALAKTTEAGVDLEVLPFRLDETSVAGLLDLGIRWFATDEPRRFADAVSRWRAGRQ